MNESAMVQAAARFLETKGAHTARLALVLGSGLKRFAERVEAQVEIPFHEVPHWPVPKVEGHGGSLVLGKIEGLEVACLTGRVHLYEGWDPGEACRAVRSLRRAGVPRFLLTNAAGGIRGDLRAGDLMVIEDHVNLTGRTPLLGPVQEGFGPRFPDQSAVWSPRLAGLLHAADPRLATGVYAGLLGPSYETPAEIAMLKAIGADAVGMSTVVEAIALNAMKAEICGLSLISNLAAGIADKPLSHDEVTAAGEAAQGRMEALVRRFCAALARG